jgi:hypothetical protein
MAKKMAKQAKAAKAVGSSASSIAIARALTEHWDKDAERIVGVMKNAATSKSMQRKLGRVQEAFASLRKEPKQ